ncbi:hypothetical protein JRC04_05320 [Mycolicibacterium sp. S2-37]|uniref:hypothetical protein n=1 Tax=Mycolicibacterium sp. S2-37 TaxID=2810297 RepID=UPI001A942743|nr:hypothetical protein [Mycolicibacterium sp. S2-37]MBO0676875.1 hypothetical protein [Mycolicibacterium sp. S2-37]
MNLTEALEIDLANAKRTLAVKQNAILVAQEAAELAEEEVQAIEERLAEARAAEEAAKDPYPVGTVLRRERHIAVRVKKIHSSAGDKYNRQQVDTPCWVTVHDDFSGRSYPTYADLIAGDNPFTPSYKVLYNPADR